MIVCTYGEGDMVFWVFKRSWTNSRERYYKRFKSDAL